MSVRTDVLIPERPQAIWEVLIDLPSYPSWNPFIRGAEGVVRASARWRVELTLDGRLFFPIPVVVVDCVPGNPTARREELRAWIMTAFPRPARPMAIITGRRLPSGALGKSLDLAVIAPLRGILAQRD